MSFINPYNNTDINNSKGEIDLRIELNEIFLGSNTNIAKGRYGLIRKMRRDQEDNLIQCTCRDSLTNEPARDSFCRHCHGMGFNWDETKAIYYKNNKLNINKDQAKFYLFSSEIIRDEDYIVEVNLDLNGIPINPIKRNNFYNIIEAIPMRLDFGRIEYWDVSCQLERKWSVYYGIKNRKST